MVADLELESVEEFTLDIFGQPAKIGFNDRQPVKEARIARGRRFGSCGQLAELGLQALPVGCDLGEAVPELAAPLLVDVLVAGGLVLAKFLDDVGLLPLQISDLAPKRGQPRGGSVVNGWFFGLAGDE